MTLIPKIKGNISKRYYPLSLDKKKNYRFTKCTFMVYFSNLNLLSIFAYLMNNLIFYKNKLHKNCLRPSHNLTCNNLGLQISILIIINLTTIIIA